MLMRIHTSMNQWQRSWPGGKLSKRTSTVSTVMTNGYAFCRFFLSGWNAREVSPGCTLTIESIHGSEKGQTPFASTWVGKRSYCNRVHKVLPTYDMRRFTPQSPVGKGSIMGSVIRNRVGRLNRPPDLKTRTRPRTPPRHPWYPPPPPLAHRARYYARETHSKGFWHIKQGYRRKNQGLDRKTGNNPKEEM